MGKSLKGKITLPGDKSISHRALILAAIADGNSLISNLAQSFDVNSTINCLKLLGVKIQQVNNDCAIQGRGFNNFTKPSLPLDCGNSGTTLRLLLGLLAGSNIACTLTGDSSLQRRPIRRVITPLERMGAVIEPLTERNSCPVKVQGAQLFGKSHILTVPSAQVKTAILLAGLLARGETELVEPLKTRDHTERLLAFLGTDICVSGNNIRLKPADKIKPFEITIPADSSSSAFPMVGALLMPGSKLLITEVMINPTRTGFIEILKEMKADFQFKNTITRYNETVTDISIQFSSLQPVNVSADKAPSYIDEAPILALAASQASGKSRFCGLRELRIKESDRLTNTMIILNRIGAKTTVEDDDLIVEGPARLSRYDGECFGDHRLAMMIEIANLICEEEMSFKYQNEINVSFREFYDVINEVIV